MPGIQVTTARIQTKGLEKTFDSSKRSNDHADCGSAQLAESRKFFCQKTWLKSDENVFFQEKKWLWIVLLTRSMQSYQLLEKFLPKLWKFFAKHPKKRSNLSMKKIYIITTFILWARKMQFWQPYRTQIIQHPKVFRKETFIIKTIIWKLRKHFRQHSRNFLLRTCFLIAQVRQKIKKWKSLQNKTLRRAIFRNHRKPFQRFSWKKSAKIQTLSTKIPKNISIKVCEGKKNSKTKTKTFPGEVHLDT